MNGRTPITFALASSMIFMVSGISDADESISPSQVQQGFDSSPIPKAQLSFPEAARAKVGMGSYLINAVGDCSGCHSFPQFLPKGGPGSNPAASSPYDGVPSTQSLSGQLVANQNVSHYLAGGQCFGPFMARNLTPDASGLPEGLTEAEFIKALRTGEDIHCEKFPADPICALGPPTPVLQVMPWPTYHSMTDADLSAIYAYLTAIPPAQACNTVADGCPGFSGAAAASANYAYPNTPDCPNPGPPQ
jgi:hypothetical protein